MGLVLMSVNERARNEPGNDRERYTPVISTQSVDMADFYGHATFFMRLPMTATIIPVRGDCEVHGDKLTIKVMSNTLTLGMPSKPSEDDMTYNMNFEEEGKFKVKIKYLSGLRCYRGSATLEGKSQPSIAFTFANSDSPLAE